MWYEKDPSIINAKAIEGIETDIVFTHKYLQPITLSKRKFKRDFVVERKDSFDIAGIDFHYYRNDLYLLGDKYYNGQVLDLEYEPWNEYDPNAIVIRMLGRKLGYIRRYDTETVSWIMTCSKHYWATLDCSCMGFERVNISYLQEFHNTYTLPYQTDLILSTICSNEQYKRNSDFIKRNIGHTVTFDTFGVLYKKNQVAIRTDMNSVIGYIDDAFIANQYWRIPIAGFIEDVASDDQSMKLEIKLRLLMEKSVINKNYLKSIKALKKFFGSFYDAGTYSMSLVDLIKVVPRKSRSLSAYEPLVKYLKEYHAITLHIDE